MVSPPEQLGPYVVRELLGVGGMATVHRAEARGIEGFRRTVALKRLMPHLADDPVIVKSFIHEARLASKLQHHNVAQTFDLGRVDDTYFIALEYVPGPTLQQVMAQCEVVGVGAMPLPVVLSVIAQICDGLDHAHNLRDDRDRLLGIIHRDVSPSNVILSNTGCVKLIDFGIAKVTSSREAATAVGVIKGKYAYIAPEYLEGQLDLRADLFALGTIAHELLTGKALFQAPGDLETIDRLRELPIQPPSRWNREVTRDLDDIVLTALQRDPSRRWQSASAMRAALDNLIRDLGVLADQRQVLAWTEWAFAQKPRPVDTGLVRLIEQLGEPSSGARALTEAQQQELAALEFGRRTVPLPTIAPARPKPAPKPAPVLAVRAARPAPVRRESTPKPKAITPRAGVVAAPIAGISSGVVTLVAPRRWRTSSRRTWPWLVLLIAVAAAAGIAATHYLGLTFDR